MDGPQVELGDGVTNEKSGGGGGGSCGAECSSGNGDMDKATSKEGRSASNGNSAITIAEAERIRTMGCGKDRRWYSSTPPKPPKEDAQPSVIYAPPPPVSSLPASQQRSPDKEKPAVVKQDEAPIKPPAETRESVSSSAQNYDTSSSSSSSLPSDVESRRSALSARFSRFMDDLQSRFVVASQTLSDLTGYTAIEHIKARNAQLENDLATAQVDLRAARRSYQAVNERRAATQREVTTLLARKDSWSPPDLERFTVLYRQDHELETSAQRAVEQLKEAEADESRLSASLTSGILKRYHEEQVWSDRIRRQSTWGTWGLMAVNVVLFIVFQVIAEPWRRQRLMRGIAEAESGVLDDVRKELADVRTALTTMTSGVSAPEVTKRAPSTMTQDGVPIETAQLETRLIAPTVDASSTLPSSPLPSPPIQLQLFSATWPYSWHEIKAFGSNPARWKAWVLDLYSERTVNLRMRDLCLLTLQGAAAGAAIVGGLLLTLRRS